ncbi:hypothetical protein N7509_008444 [Penicillium cosmopolitanum]|uniref:nitric oxide dioxygenase n=1 Tax=Penicillium cosmopolitanum TaxID=1131564 RepID=A0A9W9VML2_9EURO|nr:uncharacterized protein N7509_008444 [Penicillium cosmopolitanum]KAJ5385903.1 hypothetical protein N7509_008444 [Penicillium cosmopolitanum]
MFFQTSLRRAVLPTPTRRLPISLSRKWLTTEQKQIVKSTIPALEQHGLNALAHAVWAYAVNIDHPEALAGAVSRIGHKHASLGVTADQYPIVGKHLLAAIKEVLGPAVTAPVVDAWGAAYQELADIFITFESNIYQQSVETPGGWKGWRKFFISDKVSESDEIISFHLTPPRQYSLSDSPSPDHFRISVKQEFASGPKPAGRISNVLHESLPVGAELDVSMPFGDFVLDVNATSPAVLISGGVGLTPMMSMLKTIIQQQGQARQVVFIHAARNGHVHAMKQDLARITADHPSVSRIVFYEETTKRDKQGVDYDHVGRFDLVKVREEAVIPDANYYICGPQPFMKAQSMSLEAMGVSPDRIHMEVFGSPSD